jgi:hypothetical protein
MSPLRVVWDADICEVLLRLTADDLTFEPHAEGSLAGA